MTARSSARLQWFLVGIQWILLAMLLGGVECLSKELPSETSSEESSSQTVPASEADQHFLKYVQPLLESRCIACHGTEQSDGELRLDSRDAVLKGGETGPAVVLGNPDESLLLQAIRHSHASLRMPPKERLTDRETASLEQWIREGAPWPSTPPAAMTVASEAIENIGDAWTDPNNPIVKIFGGERLDLWSLRPITRPETPSTVDQDWSRNDLDRFVLDRLEKDAIQPPAAAVPRVIARRLYFDLSGLPPTHQQIVDFEESCRELGVDGAIDRLVDSLLETPRFGEHLARMWMDVVRYSDSNGFDWDEFRPQAWRFRDYVIRSFNADKPLDQFITEQLAGDELLEGPPRNLAEQDCLIATGYLRLGPYDNAAGLFNEQDRSRAELLADLTETTASAFLGLTFNCCRCHDHKYDPFSQADHYRLRAFFAATKFADDLPLDLAEQQQEIRQYNDRLESQTGDLQRLMDGLPESEQAERGKLRSQIEKINRQRRPWTHGLLMSDTTDDVATTFVFFQGNHLAPRDSVQPGFPSALKPQPASLVASTNPQTTGRRLTLAGWIASNENPWTARVYVNRIWQMLLGSPLVDTANDFGLAGSPPHDVQLLDWLASEFVREGWSTKRLVRLIVSSATYRQAASFQTEHFGLRNPRRLSAEQLRDSMLTVSGLLNAKSSGPPVWPDLPTEVLAANPAFLDDNETKTKGWYPSPKEEQYCRSLFLVQKRNTRVPLLETFDLPDNSTPCARRGVSTVAPQALMLLNSQLTSDVAVAMASRIQQVAGDDLDRQLRLAFEFALQRMPNDREDAMCRRLLGERSLEELCRVLINLNEFAYLD